jgi:hypothetical protein
MKKWLLFSLINIIALTAFAQADSTLKDYTGRYVFPEGNVVPDVTVVLEGNGLTMSSSAGTSALEKTGVDSFTVVEFSGTAVFKRDASNKVNAVHIEAAGYVMDGTKEEGKGFAWIIRRQPYALLTPAEFSASAK